MALVLFLKDRVCIFSNTWVGQHRTGCSFTSQIAMQYWTFRTLYVHRTFLGQDTRSLVRIMENADEERVLVIINKRIVFQLMLSEWLVEKPEDFEDNWVMVPCPAGRRSLIIASKVSSFLPTLYGSFFPWFCQG